MFQKIYGKGDIIFQEGDPGSEMFVIRSGSVRVTKVIADKEVELSIFKEGDFFGEMSLFLNEARTATVTTLENTEVFTLTKDSFINQIQKEPKLALHIIIRLIKRLKNTNEVVQKELNKDFIFDFLQSEEYDYGS